MPGDLDGHRFTRPEGLVQWESIQKKRPGKKLTKPRLNNLVIFYRGM